MKVMKMQLLIVISSILFCSCQRAVDDINKIDDYEFYSLYEFGKEIKKPNDVDVIANLRDSKRIKGPVIGIDVKTLLLVNKGEVKDTLKVIIYGKDNKYFRIGEDFYQAENSIFSK